MAENIGHVIQIAGPVVDVQFVEANMPPIYEALRVVSDGFSDYADFDVTGSGYFDQIICFAATTVTINGVAVPMPTSRNVQLASGSWVKVEWESSSLVEVNDTEGTDGERRY